MAQTIRIDFVGDVTCPWSLVGLLTVFNALEAVRDDVNPELFIQPYEIHPELDRDGVIAADYLMNKYGATPEQVAAGREQTKAQAARFGFVINQGPQSKLWNTRDAHRLLYWTSLEGKTLPLLMGFYRAYFTEQRSLSDHAVLLDVVGAAGLDVARARSVLSSGEYNDDVAAKERSALNSGVVRVPTTVFNQTWTVEGAMTPQVYITTIRDIMSGELERN